MVDNPTVASHFRTSVRGAGDRKCEATVEVKKHVLGEIVAINPCRKSYYFALLYQGSILMIKPIKISTLTLRALQ